MNKPLLAQILCTITLMGILPCESADSYNNIEHPDQVKPEEVALEFMEGIKKLPPH